MWTRRCPKATLSVPHKAPSTNDIFGSVELLTKFRSKKSKKNVYNRGQGGQRVGLGLESKQEVPRVGDTVVDEL